MNKRRRNLLILLGVVIVLISIVWAIYRSVTTVGWAWTGIIPYKDKGGEFYRGISLWGVIELLIVPAVLAIIALWFERSERRSEREIVTERQREANLQAYLDKMADLLLNEDLLRRSGDPGEPVRNVAQTRTTTILRTLDKDRRDIVFQFLRDAGLAKTLLVGADLEKIDLGNTDVSRINLSRANLNGAKLTDGNLRGADLSGANLFEANLIKADLIDADLKWAFFAKADLSGANLPVANLSGRYLGGVKLSGADLSGADLSKADLREANLSGAVLRFAVLTDAKIKDEQLAQAKSLEGAIMPDGKKYEEWIKNRDKDTEK